MNSNIGTLPPHPRPSRTQDYFIAGSHLSIIDPKRRLRGQRGGLPAEDVQLSIVCRGGVLLQRGGGLASALQALPYTRRCGNDNYFVKDSSNTGKLEN